jgi:Fe-S cluster assembly protein SufB
MPENHVYKAKKGLNEQIVKDISVLKNEPDWMKRFRLKAYNAFKKRKMPDWGADLSKIDFTDIYYYIKPTEKQVNSWNDLPKEIKDTYDRIGVPEAEKNFLSGVSAQYESEVVYESINRELNKRGVIFCDMDTALKISEIIREYFGTLISPHDNKFVFKLSRWSAALRLCSKREAADAIPVFPY